MARNIAWVVAGLLLLPVPGGAQPPQQRAGQPAAAAKPDSRTDRRPERVKWWIDPKSRAELGITDQQSAAVEAIWQKSFPALHEGRDKLTKLEDALSKLTEGTDEAAVIAQTEKVESLRAELNKARTLMIYRMDRVLKPEQRAKVKAMMHDQREPPRRGSSPR
jgi:Spy/CpxP family protein refolding chaperone